jgi:bifunctional DNA-binding transcriptional regulator/antitoxin component of YhaV-PrlF toxin-antitoxin module
MQSVKYIKSFSRGQITIPKDLREELGVPEEFWMKIFIDDGKLVVEPVSKEISKDDYVQSLLSMDTSWFTEDDYQDYQKIRQEADEHADKNSL